MSMVTDIANLVSGMLEGVHTAMPAVVVSYDKKKGTAKVTPTVRAKLKGGMAVDVPTIDNVPVLFPRSAMFDIEFPIRKGDEVLLVVAECDMGRWKATDGKERATPTNSAKFQLGGAVAIPGLYPKRTEGACRMVLEDDGTLSFSARKVKFGCPVVVDSNLMVRKDVFVGEDAMGVSVRNHMHNTAVGPASTPLPMAPNAEPEALIPPLIEVL